MASVPFVLTDWESGSPEWFPSVPFSVPGLSGPELSVSLVLLLMVAVASTIVVRLARRLLAERHRMLVATLALSGFFWALPMLHNTSLPNHAYEALFYVGVPLVFYSLLLLYVRKRWGRGPVVGLAVAALLAFVVSAFQMDRRRGPDAQAADLQRATLAEFGTIRETTRGKVVLVLGSVEPERSWQALHPHYVVGYVLRYYLAGGVLTHFPDMEAAARTADFIVSPDRVESDALLTPGNEQVFLYDSAGTDDLVELYRATYRQVVSGEPAARSHFDVYLSDGRLFHVREPCVREDVGYRINVVVVPEDPKDLPRGYRRDSEKLLSFFPNSGVRFDGKCMAILRLPDYPISVLRTGQQPLIHRHTPPPGGHRGWRVEIRAGR